MVKVRRLASKDQSQLFKSTKEPLSAFLLRSLESTRGKRAHEEHLIHPLRMSRKTRSLPAPQRLYTTVLSDRLSSSVSSRTASWIAFRVLFIKALFIITGDLRDSTPVSVIKTQRADVNDAIIRAKIFFFFSLFGEKPGAFILKKTFITISGLRLRPVSPSYFLPSSFSSKDCRNEVWEYTGMDYFRY